MNLMLWSGFAVLVVLADQLVKWLVVQHIPLYSQVAVIPGLFHLTYVRNTGAAFSLFSGMRWLFILIFLGFTIILLYEYKKKSMPFSSFDRWCIAAIYAGGLGNVIDRVRLGYVVDMIEVEFFSFPVFNVADCFITCGCVLLCVSLLFFNKKFWKDGEKS